MLIPQLLRSHVKHVDFSCDGNPVWARLSLPARLFGEVRDHGIDIVQTRTPVTTWIGRAVARRLKAKCIATLHTPFVGTTRIAHLVEQRQARADALVAVSDYIARNAIAHMDNQTVAIRRLGSEKQEVLELGAAVTTLSKEAQPPF